jgi:hypothetical protein
MQRRAAHAGAESEFLIDFSRARRVQRLYNERNPNKQGILEQDLRPIETGKLE